MWGQAPYSCHQENVFMRDLSPSALLCSCHCTQWVGVASLMIENKYSSSQTNDISCLCDKGLSCLPSVCVMSRVDSKANHHNPPVSHELLQHRLIFLPCCFSETARCLLNVNMLEGPLTKRAAKSPTVCLWGCSICQLDPGEGSSPPKTFLHLPHTLQTPASQMWSHSAGHPKILPPHHGDAHSRNPATFTSHNRAAL